MTEKEAKRQELITRVKQAEASLRERNLREQARIARERTSGFIGEHPISSVVGGVVLGIVIGSLIPTRKVTRKSAGFAAIAGDYGLAWLKETRRLAEQGARAGRVVAGKMEKRSIELREDAEEAADDMIKQARSVSRKAGRSAARKLEQLRNIS
ncbi:MAG: hypothetical protein ACK5NN_01735 [Sphingomonadaceae bacterium]